MDKEEVELNTLKASIEENRKFRKEIMKILYGLILGLCITVFLIEVCNIFVTYIYFYSPSEYSIESKATNTNINTNINNDSNEDVKVDVDNIKYRKKGSDK